MRKLVSGLRDLYEYDVLHRDLKLPNILLHFPNCNNGLQNETTSNGDTLFSYILEDNK